MRKFFLGAALVAASFGMAQSADAATVMDVDGVSTVLAISDYEGTYNGTMDQIKNTSGMQPTARKQNYPNRLNRF